MVYFTCLLSDSTLLSTIVPNFLSYCIAWCIQKQNTLLSIVIFSKPTINEYGRKRLNFVTYKTVTFGK